LVPALMKFLGSAAWWSPSRGVSSQRVTDAAPTQTPRGLGPVDVADLVDSSSTK
jgi:hypothetical protein